MDMDYLRNYHAVTMEFAWSMNGFRTALPHANSVQTPYKLHTNCVMGPSELYSSTVKTLFLS